jgi:hypothetical protein
MNQPELHVWIIRSTDKPDAYVMDVTLLSAVRTYLNHIKPTIKDMDNIFEVLQIEPHNYEWHKVNGKQLDLLIRERGQFAGVLTNNTD